MLNQPYKLLLLTGLLLIAISLFLFKRTLDINVGDTYYIIALNQVCWTLAVVLLLFSLLYWWAGNILLSPTMSWLHVAITIFMSILIVTAPAWMRMVEQSFTGDILTVYKQKSKFYRGLWIFSLSLLAGQLLFFVNLFGGIVKKYI